MRGSEVPEDILRLRVTPGKPDPTVGELVGLLEPPNTDSTLLFGIYGPTYLLRQCVDCVKEAARTLGPDISQEFVAALWDIAQHEPTPEVIVGLLEDFDWCIGRYIVHP